jgi:hypothetical protein
MEVEEKRVPDWVDPLVECLLADYMVAAGPAGTVIVGKLGQESGVDRWVWRSATDMEESVFGNRELAIAGPHKAAILTRLRRGAHVRAAGAPMHPLSCSGVVARSRPGRDGVWQHTANDGATTYIGDEPDCVIINSHTISNLEALTRLGLSVAAGAWKRVHGTLQDAHLAYAGVKDKPLELVIPCQRGVERDVIMVVEQEEGLDVLGFHMSRPLGAVTRARFRPISNKFQQQYFALFNMEKGVRKVRVLKLPEG